MHFTLLIHVQRVAQAKASDSVESITESVAGQESATIRENAVSRMIPVMVAMDTRRSTTRRRKIPIPKTTSTERKTSTRSRVMTNTRRKTRKRRTMLTRTLFQTRVQSDTVAMNMVEVESKVALEDASKADSVEAERTVVSNFQTRL